MMNIKVKKVQPYNDSIPLPFHQTPGSAGVDLYSQEALTLAPGESRVVRTGISIQLPQGYEAQVRTRSGLAAKYKVVVLNSPGTVDADYRGEIKVILHNGGAEWFYVLEGDRIAQMVVAKHETVFLEEVDNLADSERGTGGFGSTGTGSKP